MGRGLSVESQALSAHPRAACLVRTHAGQPGKPGAAPGSLSPEPAYRRCASRPRVLEDDLSAVGVADCRPGSGLCWVYHELCRRIPVRSVQFALFPNFSTARTRPRGPGSPECRPSPCLLPGSQRGCWSPLTHKPWVPEPYWRIEGTRVDHRRIPWFSTRWFCNPPGDAGQCLKTLGTWKLGRGGCYWYLMGGRRKAICGTRNVDQGAGGRAESTRGPVLFHSRPGTSCNPGHSWLPLASLPFLSQEKCRGQ